MYIEDREERLRAAGFAPGQRYLHDLLRDYQPGWALARQWAGLERETEMLQREIGRMRSLVTEAAYDLEACGQERKGRRLVRPSTGADRELESLANPLQQLSRRGVERTG
jgi:hypothetical protein